MKWRYGEGGKANRSNLRDVDLRFGDALLLLGPRDKPQMLGREPDFIVLTEKHMGTATGKDEAFHYKKINDKHSLNFAN